MRSNNRDHERDNITRGLIYHESNLINQRLSWLLTIQGFLIAGVSFAVQHAKPLSWLFPTVGLISSLSALFAIFLAHMTICKEVKVWEENNPPFKADDFPAIIGRHRKHNLEVFICPWFLLPVVFIFIWLFVAYYIRMQ
jgi:hypothetical protein